jgi:DNA-binding NtrC family response regulator
MEPHFVPALQQLPFPGNVRQLENLLRRILLEKEDGEPISLADLPPEAWQQLVECECGVPNGVSATPVGSDRPQAGTSAASTDLRQAMMHLLEANRWNLTDALKACEAVCVRAALHEAAGNQSRAARLLGITARSVYNKIRKHRLQTP